MEMRDPASALLRRRFGSHRLVAYAMLLFLGIGAVQFGASLLFYEAIDREALREDHARRVAELLVVSDRVNRRDPAVTAQTMTSHYLDVRVAQAPTVRRSGLDDAVIEIREYILAWEPTLAARPLALDIMRSDKGRSDLVGSMRLGDGRWLNFRSRDISTGWPIVLRATAMTLLITLLCIGMGAYALRRLMAPLRRLSEAVAHLDDSHAPPLDERGPADLRNLTHAFNDMRARIAGLEDDQSRSFEAISHDLRTPLSRLKIASDFVSDSDIGRIVRSSADEMEAMLMSLQRFLRAQHLESVAEPLDLTALVTGLIADLGDKVRLVAPAQALTISFREPLELVLGPLIENALHYGTQVEIRIRSAGEDWWIEIADNGPGIAEAYFEDVLDPFFRVDEARARDTDGFGLGIPTAHRLLQRFGGALAFSNAPGGGLVVRVTAPRPGPA
jgi:signal transduction histidine kinase